MSASHPSASHASAPRSSAQYLSGPYPSPRVSRRKRYLTMALIVLVTPLFLLGTAIAATGVATVKVHEHGAEGTHLFIPVPALLFDVAVAVAPMVVPEAELAEARREVAPYREGLLALAAELERMPPGVLVDVVSDGDHVTITKGWRSFEIKVQSADADVHVSVPARLLGRALDVL